MGLGWGRGVERGWGTRPYAQRDWAHVGTSSELCLARSVQLQAHAVMCPCHSTRPPPACSNCEKAGKLKGAKAQRRIISQLESQQRVIEQQLKQREAAASGGGGSGAAPRRRGGRRSSDGGSSQPGSPRRRKPEQDYFSYNDFEQEQRYPTVLYSDEE